MPMANKMTALLNKIERKLGTKQLNLPKEYSKAVWAEEVIANETLDTFSRYIPNAVDIRLDRSMKDKEGWYLIDEVTGDDVEIIGVRDIDWQRFSQTTARRHDAYGFGYYDFLANNYGMDDIALLQARADQMSLFNNNIFTEFQPPNKVRFNTVTGSDITTFMSSIPVTILIKHALNLQTIPPTMMETFEDLAIADVAGFLYQNLKYYDGLETVFASSDLRLSDLENAASKRDDIVEKLNDAHVSAANKHQPIMYTV